MQISNLRFANMGFFKMLQIQIRFLEKTQYSNMNSGAFWSPLGPGMQRVLANAGGEPEKAWSSIRNTGKHSCKPHTFCRHSPQVKRIGSILLSLKGFGGVTDKVCRQGPWQKGELVGGGGLLRLQPDGDHLANHGRGSVPECRQLSRSFQHCLPIQCLAESSPRNPVWWCFPPWT